MSDTDRIADYLLEHGSVTSYELSKMGMSGNPSQRIQDIRDRRGWVIDSERFTRTDPHGTKRPCCRYRLVGGEGRNTSASRAATPPSGQSPERAPVTDRNGQVGLVAGESSTSIGAEISPSSEPRDAAPKPRQVTDADGSPGRDPSASLLQLFDMPANRWEDAA